MTLEITSDFAVTCTELAHLGVGAAGLHQYRITITDQTGFVAHRTTATCSAAWAERIASQFLRIWPNHSVTTEQLD